MSGSGPYQEDPNAGQPGQPGGGMPPPPPPAGDSGFAPPPPPAGQPGWGAAPGAQGFGGGQPMSTFGRPLAEWWKRVVALIIDALLIGIPLAIIQNIIGLGAASQLEVDSSGAITGGGGGFFATLIVGNLLTIAAFLIYFGVMNGGAKGQTVGKMAMKIQVRDEATGGPIGVGKGLLRYVVSAALSLVCGIGGIIDGLFPLWDAKRQTIHDKAVKSVVVDAAA